MRKPLVLNSGKFQEAAGTDFVRTIPESTAQPSSPSNGDLWLDTSGASDAGLYSQSTAPSNPTTGDLWLDTSAPSVVSSGMVDLTNYPADYLLKVGETAFVTFSSATLVKTNIKVETGGMYDVNISSLFSANTASNENKFLIGGKSALMWTIGTKNVGGSLTGYYLQTAGYLISNGGLQCAKLTISSSGSAHSVSVANVNGAYAHLSLAYPDSNEITTLGNITFSTGHTGKVIVRRIA